MINLVKNIIHNQPREIYIHIVQLYNMNIYFYSMTVIYTTTQITPFGMHKLSLKNIIVNP